MVSNTARTVNLLLQVKPVFTDARGGMNPKVTPPFQFVLPPPEEGVDFAAFAMKLFPRLKRKTSLERILPLRPTINQGFSARAGICCAVEIW